MDNDTVSTAKYLRLINKNSETDPIVENRTISRKKRVEYKFASVGVGSLTDQTSILICDFGDSFHGTPTFTNILHKDSSLLGYFSKISDLLIDEDGDYDDEFVIPSGSSIGSMKTLIRSLHNKFGEKLAPVKFVANGKGGIEAVIRSNNKVLHLVVPGDESKAPYLFKKEGNEYGIVRFSKTSELIDSFNWIL